MTARHRHMKSRGWASCCLPRADALRRRGV